MKYRVKKITEYSRARTEFRSLYYPQVRKWGLWRYMFDNTVDNRDAICFFIEQQAWKHIDSLRSYERVEYLYEPSGDNT